MANFLKYFNILENLQYSKGFKEEKKQLPDNLEKIEKLLKIKPLMLNDLSTLKSVQCPQISAETAPDWIFSCYLFHVLLTIIENVNFESSDKEDLLSVRQLQQFFDARDLMCRMAIVKNLPEIMQREPFFGNRTVSVTEMGSENSTSLSYERLAVGLRCIQTLYSFKTIASHNAPQNSSTLEIMAGIFSLLNHNKHCLSENSADVNKLHSLLNTLWNFTGKDQYFKNLLILKSIKKLPVLLQQNLHQELLEKLTEKEGFTILARNIVPPQNSDRDDGTPDWKRFEVIARIVSHKGHTDDFYSKIIDNILEFISTPLSRTDYEKALIPAGLLALRNLCDLDANHELAIKDRIQQKFNRLIRPDDILTGIVVMDHFEFRELLNYLVTCFCGSSLLILPSKFLTGNLHVLLNLYSQLPTDSSESIQIKSLVVQCLSNRNKAELLIVIRDLFTDSINIRMHPRVTVKQNAHFNAFSLQIDAQRYDFDASGHLLTILKLSNNNLLLYDTFLSILKVLEEDYTQDNNAGKINVDLIQDQKEFDELVEKKFKTKMSILSSLSDLITIRSFHSQFNENPTEILDFIKRVLSKRIKDGYIEVNDDHNLTLVLAILQQFLEVTKFDSKHSEILSILRTLKAKLKDELTLQQVDSILNALEHGGSASNSVYERSKYEFAKSLTEEAQPHLKVYGITQIIKLIKEKDIETLSHSHEILALSLNLLRDDESYTYLNCVRMLIALVNILEAQVLEAISSAYLNENELLDYRLKIGEALVKVTEDLGQISYKYKDVLINCFLHGCKNSQDDFRASSLSNLATICHLLSYQVLGFFQELIAIVTEIIQTDQYLPAKRAAVLVLAQLLKGVPNLMDFQDLLLPIYRVLNQVIANESDERARVHATNGLEFLKIKCKEFIFSEQKLEKGIKIFGIKD